MDIENLKIELKQFNLASEKSNKFVMINDYIKNILNLFYIIIYYII
jgi:hypothetical protein